MGEKDISDKSKHQPAGADNSPSKDPKEGASKALSEHAMEVRGMPQLPPTDTTHIPKPDHVPSRDEKHAKHPKHEKHPKHPKHEDHDYKPYGEKYPLPKDSQENQTGSHDDMQRLGDKAGTSTSDADDSKSQAQSFDRNLPKLELVDKNASSLEKTTEQTNNAAAKLATSDQIQLKDNQTQNDDRSIVTQDSHGRATEIDYPNPPGGKTVIDHGPPMIIDRYKPDGAVEIWEQKLASEKDRSGWTYTKVNSTGAVVDGREFQGRTIDSVYVATNGEIDIKFFGTDSTHLTMNTNGTLDGRMPNRVIHTGPPEARQVSPEKQLQSEVSDNKAKESSGEHSEKSKEATVHKDDQGRVNEVDYPTPPGGRTVVAYGPPIVVNRQLPDGSTIVVQQGLNPEDPNQWSATKTDAQGNLVVTKPLPDTTMSIASSGQLSISYTGDPGQCNWFPDGDIDGGFPGNPPSIWEPGRGKHTNPDPEPDR